jgi:hypothetical protein
MQRCESVVCTTDSDRVDVQSFFMETPISDPESDRKSDLECLRLASELIELATRTLNPGLKAHCLRMAAAWSDKANQGSGR